MFLTPAIDPGDTEKVIQSLPLRSLQKADTYIHARKDSCQCKLAHAKS